MGGWRVDGDRDQRGVYVQADVESSKRDKTTDQNSSEEDAVC